MLPCGHGDVLSTNGQVYVSHTTHAGSIPAPSTTLAPQTTAVSMSAAPGALHHTQTPWLSHGQTDAECAIAVPEEPCMLTCNNKATQLLVSAISLCNPSSQKRLAHELGAMYGHHSDLPLGTATRPSLMSHSRCYTYTCQSKCVFPHHPCRQHTHSINHTGTPNNSSLHVSYARCCPPSSNRISLVAVNLKVIHYHTHGRPDAACATAVLEKA